jgi:hypothetical protein
MGAFEAIAQTMAEMGIFEYFFPWLLTLAISYGILDQYEVISEDDTVNGVTALSIAFFVIGAAYMTLGAGVFVEFAGALAFGIFGVIGFIILLGVSGVDLSEYDELEGNLPAVAAILIFLMAFGGTLLTQTQLFASLGPIFSGSSGGSDILMQFLVLLFLLLVIIFVARSDDDS